MAIFLLDSWVSVFSPGFLFHFIFLMRLPEVVGGVEDKDYAQMYALLFLA